MSEINLLEFIKKYGKLNVEKEHGMKSISISSELGDLMIEYKNNSILNIYNHHTSIGDIIKEEFCILGDKRQNLSNNNLIGVRFTSYPTNTINHCFSMHYNSMWIAWTIETKDKDMEHRIFLRRYNKIRKITGVFQIGDEYIHIYDNLKEGDKLVKYLEETLELDSRITEDGYYIPTSKDIKDHLNHLENKIEETLKNLKDDKND